VTARLMDRQYVKIGPDMSAISELDSPAHSPSYYFRAEIRESNLPPTATLLFKVCMLDFEINECAITILVNVYISCLSYFLLPCSDFYVVGYMVHYTEFGILKSL